MEKPNAPVDVQERKKQLEFQMLRNSLDSDKRIVESFLEDVVCEPLVQKIKEIIQNLLRRAQELQTKEGQRTPQEQSELRNILSLAKKAAERKSYQYWELLQLLYKFPNQYQIAVDGTLVSYLSSSRFFKSLNRFVPATRYMQHSWSFKRFLTDCVAFARLRRLQLKYMEETAPGQSPLEKALLLEKEFAVIPDSFLLERRIGGHDFVHVYKGMDLAKNIPVVIKFLVHEAEDEKSKFREISFQEAKRRFEREAQAFEKLERHRQAKEQAITMLREQGNRQIEEGKAKGSPDKIKAGMALLKQSEELLCDRYFVRAYCLATGELSYFHVGDDGFFRERSQTVGFMVMEYVEGTDLRSLLNEYKEKKIPVPMKVFVPIMEGVLEALEYCHTENIIHRDVRPENILITRNFKVRLTNLGRAKVEDMTQLTAQGAFVGTPEYAAPEGIVHGVQNVKDFASLVTATDHRFDLYSLGCVAYEMLTNRIPFSSSKNNLEAHDEEILLKHLKETPVAPSQIRKDIPETIGLMVLKMLAKKPDDRFSSARETLLTLRATLSFGQKAGEYTQKLLERIRPPVPETVYPAHKTSWLVKIAAVLVIIFILTAPFIYIFRDEVLPWLDQTFSEFRKTVKYEVRQLIQQDEKECEKAQEIADRLEQYHQGLHEKWLGSQKFYAEFQQNFSPDQGYLPADSIIPVLLQKAGQELDELEQVILSTRQQLEEEGGVAALKVILPYENFETERPHVEGLIKRIYNKLEHIYNLNASKKKARDDEEQTRASAQALRNQLYSAKEQLALAEERLAIKEERYPSSQKYPEIPAKLLQNLSTHKIEIQKLEAVVYNINKLLSRNDLAEIDQVIYPYRNFAENLTLLNDDASSLEQFLTACKEIQTEREQKQTVDRAFVLLDERSQLLEKQLQETQDMWQESQKTLAQAPPKPEFFEQAQTELKKIASTQQQLSQYQSNKQTKEALDLAETIAASSESLVYRQLREYRQQLQDQIRVTLAMKEAAEQEKQNAKLQKQVAGLLTQAQNKIQQLADALANCQQEVTLLEQRFPKEIAKIQSNKQTLQETKQKKATWDQLLQNAQKKLDQRDLSGAYQILSEKERELSNIDRLVAELSKSQQLIRGIYKEAEKAQQSQQLLSQCNRTLQKLQNYIKIMDDQIKLAEDSIQKLTQEYPPERKYPQISEASRKILSDGKKSLEFYQKEAKKAKDLITKKDYIKAFQILLPFEAKRLEGYSQFQNQLPQLEQDLAQTRSKAMQTNLALAKTAKIVEYQEELQTRRQTLYDTISQLDTKLRALEQYSSQAGYKAPDPNIRVYIKKTQDEEIV